MIVVLILAMYGMLEAARLLNQFLDEKISRYPDSAIQDQKSTHAYT